MTNEELTANGANEESEETGNDNLHDESTNQTVAEAEATAEQTNGWLDRQLSPALPWLTYEVIIFAIIVLLAVATRFYDLGTRVMSHDESLHTYYSWTFSQGQGYIHNPMMHGPLQFHLIALSYFMFGASDFTARIPAVTFSIATVALAWLWRRYLGRAGALVAAGLALISPFLLFYGRYTREDPYVGVSLFVMLYAILRYFETGGRKYIYLISGSLVLHYLTKETGYIYNAQILIFLALFFVVRVLQRDWSEKSLNLSGFLVSLGLSAALFLSTFYLGIKAGDEAHLQAATLPGPEAAAGVSLTPLLISFLLMLAAMIATVFFLARGLGWQAIRAERSFDLLMVFGTLVLPHLSPIPVYMVGWNPLDYSSEGMLHTGLFLVPLVALTLWLGFWWNKEIWWRMALIYWIPYTLLYTTLFTNGAGFFTGVVGSLGYWLEQHAVERGSQPWYYYILIQIPVYEFLPFLASLLGLFIGYRRWSRSRGEQDSVSLNLANTYTLLVWWVITSIVAFSIAGEKMPWLTFHMSLPMVLFSGLTIGSMIERVDWRLAREKNIWLTLGLLLVFTFGIVGMMLPLFGEVLPFSGSELAQLQVTLSFILALIATIGSGIALVFRLEGWPFKQLVYVHLLLVFALLGLLTIRTSFRATYVNYDSGREYLVYAHSYTGTKDVLRQVEQLSNRLNGGRDIVVGYDDDVSWPMSWYMRDFRNARYYGNQPGRDLRDAPAIIVGDNNYSKIEPVVGDAYYRFDYIRMVWPNQDYFALTPERIWEAISNPQIRAGIFDIWLNRDYTRYGRAVNSTSVTDENWQPSDRMRLYIRKDVAAMLWQYGSAPASAPVADPYEGGNILLPAELVIGQAGTEPGQFNGPRGIAIAPNGDIYVADSRNHRIQQFDANGQLIRAWGTFSGLDISNAAPGTFNEPWGVAVGPDGSVYVSDTWNHRIQKFSAEGEFITMWGVFGLTDTPGGLYGPRGLTVDSQGRVYVADTGNKRIVVYDSNGNLFTQFGSEGFGAGEFYEPVDVKIDSNGLAYVTDTWNQRVQVFSSDASGMLFMYLTEWPIAGWYSESLENKPFIAIAPNGNVYVTDPEGYRVIEFNADGSFVRTWGDYGTEYFAFGLPSGIASDKDGNIWVSDAGGNRLMRFRLP
jgi:predicted membrane-bound mannosyltransferase/DNA-binding beta-propeller fold protein YncE